MVNAAIKECKSPIKSVNRGNDLDTPIPKRKKKRKRILLFVSSIRR